VSEEMDDMTIEEVVDEYERLRLEKSAIVARMEALKSRIEGHYKKNTAHEGETIEVSAFTLQFVDTGRTSMWSKREFAKKYGPHWVKNHIKKTWYSRMNLKPKNKRKRS